MTNSLAGDDRAESGAQSAGNIKSGGRASSISQPQQQQLVLFRWKMGLTGPQPLVFRQDSQRSVVRDKWRAEVEVSREVTEQPILSISRKYIALHVCTCVLAKQPISCKDLKGQKLVFPPTLLLFITVDQLWVKHTIPLAVSMCSVNWQRDSSPNTLMLSGRVLAWDLHTDHLCPVGCVWSSVLQVTEGVSLSNRGTHKRTGTWFKSREWKIVTPEILEAKGS
jgi:hypothetical protein